MAEGSLVYVEKHQFIGQHQGPVNCIAFSPKGDCIATGGHDHKVVLWSCATGAARYVFVAESGVTSLLWPHQPPHLIVGTDNGMLMLLSISAVCRCCALW